MFQFSRTTCVLFKHTKDRVLLGLAKMIPTYIHGIIPSVMEYVDLDLNIVFQCSEMLVL